MLACINSCFCSLWACASGENGQKQLLRVIFVAGNPHVSIVSLPAWNFLTWPSHHWSSLQTQLFQVFAEAFPWTISCVSLSAEKSPALAAVQPWAACVKCLGNSSILSKRARWLPLLLCNLCLFKAIPVTWDGHRAMLGKYWWALLG